MRSDIARNARDEFVSPYQIAKHQFLSGAPLVGHGALVDVFNRFYELPLGGNNIDIYTATGSMTPVAGRGRSASINLTATF